jgi:cell division septum initiation protein DivIVA
MAEQARIELTAVDKTRQAFLAAQNNLRGLGEAAGRLNGVFAGLGVTLGVGSMGTLIKSSIDAADAFNDLSARTGVAIETLVGLEYAAKLGDTSLDAISQSIGRLNKSIGEAENGNAAMAESLRTLGITSKDPAEALAQLADYVQAIPDPTKRAAELNKVLGKSYQELLPLLEGGGEALREMVAEGQRLNPITTEMARQAGIFNDQLDKLKQSASGFGTKVASPIVAALNDIIPAMNQAAEESGLLKAAWVGLGGVASVSFNGTEMQQAGEKLKTLEADIKRFRETLAQNKFTGGETGKSWLDAIIPDLAMNQETRDRMTKQLQGMMTEAQQIRDRLNAKPPEQKTPNSPDDASLPGLADPDKLQTQLRKAFDLKPVDDFIQGFNDRANKIKQEYAKLSVDIGGREGPATGSDIMADLSGAKTAAAGGDTFKADALVERAKSGLKDLASFEQSYYARELQNFELSLNSAAQKTAEQTRDNLLKTINEQSAALELIDPVHIPLAAEAIAQDLRNTIDIVRRELANNPLVIPVVARSGGGGEDLARAATKLGAR